MGKEMNGKQAVIVGAAPCKSLTYLQPYLTGADFILCADGGRKNAELAGLTPDWYVGDGDSGGSPEGLPSMVLPVEKDYTDLEVAVHQAVGMGFQRLLLCACTGGRADHHLANFCLLEKAHELGAEALLLDEWNEVRFVSEGTLTLANDPPYRYLGLIPLDRALRDVTMSGVKYRAEHTDFLRTATLGVSNEILPGCEAQITIGEGRGLLIRSERLI